MIHMSSDTNSRRLRSRAWFDDPQSADMTALYLERYLNFGLTLGELQSERPIVGIAQTGSDLSPCNRHRLVLAGRDRYFSNTCPLIALSSLKITRKLQIMLFS